MEDEFLETARSNSNKEPNSLKGINRNGNGKCIMSEEWWGPIQKLRRQVEEKSDT
jgi:hypothetical protein